MNVSIALLVRTFFDLQTVAVYTNTQTERIYTPIGARNTVGISSGVDVHRDLNKDLNSCMLLLKYIRTPVDISDGAQIRTCASQRSWTTLNELNGTLKPNTYQRESSF